MNDGIVLLAVTRMLSGFCIAGIDEQGAWRRPMKHFSTLLWGDITYRNGRVMQPFDRVQFQIERDAPDPPHVEDCICDFLRRRPEWVSHTEPTERAAFLAEHSEPSPLSLLRAERSLTLVRVDAVGTSFTLDGYSGKYETRVRLPGLGDQRGVPCTDLRWRALGRSLLPPGGGRLKLNTQQIRERFGARAIYLALGLSRQLHGNYSPLVVGVHIVPDYEVTVDPKRP